MKKFAIGLMTFSLVACGESTPTDKTPVAATCTSAQSGSTQCGGVDLADLQECNGANWVVLETCAEGCEDVAGLTGVSRCKAPAASQVNEFDNCTGAGQGNCVEGLTCANFAMGGIDAGMCITECTVGGNECTSPMTCDADFAWCTTPDAARNESCGFSGHSCADSNQVCTPSNASVGSFECKVECDGGDVAMGQGTCDSGEECLAGPYVEIELDGDEEFVNCSLDPEVCSSNYECLSVNTGAATPEELCSRSEGRCGTVGPIMDGFTGDDIDAWLGGEGDLAIDNLCELPGTDTYCKAPDGFDGEVTCDSLPYVAVEQLDGATIPCASDADCGWWYGFACMELTSGSLCALEMSSCIAYCDDYDGNEFACPNSGTCAVATNDLDWPWPFIEEGDTNYVSCSGDGDCNQGDASGFTCTEFGSQGDYCARPRMVCQ